MADIIPLRDDPHQQALALLPWRATGALDADERALVDAHLDECPECRRELEREQALARAVRGLPARDEGARQAILLDAEHPSPLLRQNGGAVLRGLLRRRVSVGLAFAAQAAMLVVAVAAVLAWSSASRPRYQALESPRAASAGNVVVIFTPNASERELRAALVASGARIVDGPTASDAYVLRVPPPERDVALARLRNNARVVLAEPLDGNDLR